MAEARYQKDERYAREGNVREHELERARDSAKCDMKTNAANEKRRKESTEIATRMADGKALSKRELDKLEKSPGIRIFVRQKLKAMNLDPGTMYAESLKDGYMASKGLDPDGGEIEGMSQRDRTASRGMVMSHISDMEGIKKQAQKEEKVNPVINIMVDPGLCMKTDNNGTIKIHSDSSAKDAPPDEAQSSHQDSHLWTTGGENDGSGG